MRRSLTWLIAGGLLVAPAVATADHHNNLEISAEAALEVDILFALDLPVVFGQWVHAQVAAGVKGRELAQAIRERKAELAQSSETDAEIDAKLAKQRRSAKPIARSYARSANSSSHPGKGSWCAARRSTAHVSRP